MCQETKDLNNILEVYETELCNRIFKYQLNNKIDVEIIFYKENFCHLLGLQHVYGKNKKYLGINGYDKIKIFPIYRTIEQTCKLVKNYIIRSKLAVQK